MVKSVEYEFCAFRSCTNDVNWLKKEIQNTTVSRLDQCTHRNPDLIQSNAIFAYEHWQCQLDVAFIT